MSSIRQLRLRVINGVNYEDGLLYSEGFDLMNIVELQYLRELTQKCLIEGFTIETSTFSKGEHTNNHKENEFQTFLEYIHGDEKKKSFLFKGEEFTKMPYHIIRDSILDVNGDMSLLFATIIPGNIEGTLQSISEIFEISDCKKEKKLTYFS